MVFKYELYRRRGNSFSSGASSYVPTFTHPPRVHWAGGAERRTRASGVALGGCGSGSARPPSACAIHRNRQFGFQNKACDCGLATEHVQGRVSQIRTTIYLLKAAFLKYSIRSFVVRRAHVREIVQSLQYGSLLVPAGGQSVSGFRPLAVLAQPSWTHSRGLQGTVAGASRCMGSERRMVLGGTPAKLDILRSKLAGSSIDVNEEQPEKAPSPRLVGPAGNLIDVIEEQPVKASLPRLVSARSGQGLGKNKRQTNSIQVYLAVKPVGVTTPFPTRRLRIYQS